MKIQTFDYEVLGDLVCGVITEDCHIPCFFDYKEIMIEKEKDTLFRFVFDDFYVDYTWKQMKKEFKTIDNLIIALLKKEKQMILEKIV